MSLESIATAAFSVEENRLRSSAKSSLADPSGAFVNTAGNGISPRTPGPEAATTEILFLDGRLLESNRQLSDLPGLQVVTVDPSEDPIAVFQRTLRDVDQVDRIHLVGHGSAGQLQLGRSVFDRLSVETSRAAWQTLGELTAAGADWLLYGCSTGEGRAGGDFLDSLASATGDDVAASNDFTAAASRGGNWILETTRGEVQGATWGLWLEAQGIEALPIEIRAAGSEGDETMALQIDGRTVQTWTQIGGNAGTGAFNSFVFQNSGPLTLDRIRVALTNDLSLPDGTDRNLRVDWIRVDGVTIETEGPTVFSTGTWLPADGVQPGFRQSEFLHTDGYFQYGGSPRALNATHGISSIDSNWRNLPVPGNLANPVVFAGAASSNDDQPGTVILSRTAAGLTRARFREWNYLDGIHGSEQIDWFAIEPGRYQTLDGSLWEVGRVTISQTQSWIPRNFAGFFPEAPRVFATRQTSTNFSPSQVRLKNVTSGGFELSLFGEESLSPSSIAAETIGYLAVYSPLGSGIVGMGTAAVDYSLNSESIGSQFSLSANGIRYRLQEEQSRDNETDHTPELLASLRLGDTNLGSGGLAQIQTFLQSDTAEVRSVRIRPVIAAEFGKQQIDSTWSRLTVDSPLDSVVMTSPPSQRDTQPGLVAVRNVVPGSFEVRFREWNYLDQTHEPEWIDWIALQPGRYQTGDGSIWEVGTVSAKGQYIWTSRQFSLPFAAVPQLFLTSQTSDAGQPAVIRARNITAQGFELALCEEQSQITTAHGRETIGYLALVGAAGSGVVSIGSAAVPYLLESSWVDHNLTALSNNVKIKLEEEQSGDVEVQHSLEKVNALRLGSLVFAQAVSFVGGDVFALRLEKGLPAIQLPTGFVLERLAPEDDLSDAVALELAPDGRQFVADEGGRVWVIKNGRKLATPLIDLSGEVLDLDSDEGGLSGFVLDPKFATNRRFYLMYTVSENGSSFGRVVRYSLKNNQPDEADLASRRVLLGNSAADGLEKGTFHNTGDLEFGTDGTLLLSWGDTANNDPGDARLLLAQNLNRLAGKILRINPDNGRGYSSNPFYTGNANDNASKVWAYGLRNGFRFEVHSDTGASSPGAGRPGLIYVGEVGRFLFDELNICRGGENFGWPYFEANTPYLPGGNGLTVVSPLVTLAHPESRAVIGGAFYQGTTWPEEFRGRFFVADFVEGWIRMATPDANHTALNMSNFATGIKGLTDMEFDPLTQDIYLTGIGADSIFFDDQGLSGLYRIRYTG